MALYGYAESDWENALEDAKKMLVQRARNCRTISYSELASGITSARFDPASTPFAALLGDLSTREFDAGRGMLSVLVVHKGGDTKPGKGFFDLARLLGIAGDDEKVWIDQFKHVTEAWKSA